jgi:hypothetical protein
MRTLLVSCLLGLLTMAAAAVDGPEHAVAAKRIDALLVKSLASQQQHPNAVCSDDIFVRRCYLDCIGRIPTLAEYRAFIADRAPDKRQALVDRLLASDGHISHEFNYWAELLRVKSVLMRNLPGENYILWLKHALRDNMPYDRMVAELITAHGRAADDGNGATGYYLRDAGMPQDNMSNTVQVFLGTRLACAQCHDHPFDKWTRLDYLGMAAFTNNVKERPNEAFIRSLRTAARRDGEISKEETMALRRIAQVFGMEVISTKQATIALPKDYQYDNGKPGEVIKAHTIFGDSATVKKGDDPQRVYADWLTSPNNARFTLVIANRMWKRAFGVGLIEPVDNITDSSAASDPELMAYLVQLMKDVRYDLRAFQAILFTTSTYQRACAAAEAADGATHYFTGPKLRRMRAEQAWDSLLALAVPDIDERPGTGENKYADRFDELKGKSPEELAAAVLEIAEQQRQRKDLQKKLAELEQDGATRREILQNPKYRDLRQQLMEANGAMRGQKAQAKEADPDPRWRAFRRQLVRASELPSPAPPEHFLRVFGQSDRELIENGNDAPSITQALFLANGLVDQELTQPHTLLMQALQDLNTRQKIETIYHSVLSRSPSEDELNVLRSLRLPERELLTTIIWSLVNSDEFIFIQ